MKISQEEAKKVWEAVTQRFEKETGKKLDSSNIKDNGTEKTLIWELKNKTNINLDENRTGQTLYDNFFLVLEKKQEITLGDTFWNALQEYGKDYLLPLTETETITFNIMNLQEFKDSLIKLTDLGEYEKVFTLIEQNDNLLYEKFLFNNLRREISFEKKLKTIDSLKVFITSLKEKK